MVEGFRQVQLEKNVKLGKFVTKVGDIRNRETIDYKYLVNVLGIKDKPRIHAKHPFACDWIQRVNREYGVITIYFMIICWTKFNYVRGNRLDTPSFNQDLSWLRSLVQFVMSGLPTRNGR